MCNEVSDKHFSISIVCAVIVALFAGALSLQKIYDYDLWWHLRTGQWIVEHGAFPQADPFSFSTTGAAWTYLYGVADPLFYLLYNKLGSCGLQLSLATVLAGVAVSLFFFLCFRGLSFFGAAALTILAVQVARFRFLARPLVFKFAGIVFLFWFFFGKPHPRYRYLLFVAGVVLWNWLYPAAILAQVFTAFLLVEKLVEYFCRAPKYVPGELRDAFILLGLASLALLVNPAGVGLYQTVYGGFFADYAANSYVVEEHQPLVWSQFPLFAALVVSAGFSFWPGRKNFRLMTLLVFVSFVALAWGSVRYAGMAAFVMAGVIGVNLGGGTLPHAISRVLPERPWRNIIGLSVLVVCCVALWLTTFQKTRGYEFGLGVKPGRFPYAAVDLLTSAGFSGNIYNSWKFGGFLQWHLPEAKTFIDGRYLPAQRLLYERLQTMELHEFSRYISENRVQAALLDRQALREMDYFANMPGFRQVHADDVSVLFLRSDHVPMQVEDAVGKYRYLRLGGYEYEYLAPLAIGPEASAVEAELLGALRLAPDSFFENFQLAYFYDVRKDPRAAAQYLAAVRKNPAFAVTHFDAGRLGAQTALAARKWELALELAALALEYQPTGELYFLLGAAQHQLKKLQAAEKSYRASLSLTENGRVRNNLGFLLLEMNNPDRARDVFTEGLEKRRGLDREQSLYGLALALRELRRDQEAAGVRNRLAVEFPQSQYLRKF